MPGDYSTAQLALETLLEAEPFSFRPAVLPTKDGELPGPAETSVGDDARSYVYDLPIAGEDYWEPLTDNQFNAAAGLVITIFVPGDHQATANAQQRACMDLVERVRAGVLTSRTVEVVATGRGRAVWLKSEDTWVVTIPVMLRYEEDART